MRFVPFLLLPTAALADAPILIQPIDCTLGEDCFIQQFVDQDSTAAATDFRCGPQTYDTHKGTDFALASLTMLDPGVDVLAAADGLVLGTRNTMPDVLQSDPNAPDVAEQECGNGVVIDHGAGWHSQYCHLAQGSITVTKGQFVRAGEPLGQVGLSGRTEFPHLHMSLRHDGATVDPFDPLDDPGCTIDPATDLWEPDLPTPPGGVIAVGFSNAVPGYDAIKAGTAHSDSLPSTAPALVVWGYIHGGRAGDTVTLSIGDLYEHEVTLDRTQAQLFRAGGRRTPAEGWPPGIYVGTVTLVRESVVIGSRQTQITLTAD